MYWLISSKTMPKTIIVSHNSWIGYPTKTHAQILTHEKHSNRHTHIQTYTHMRSHRQHLCKLTWMCMHSFFAHWHRVLHTMLLESSFWTELHDLRRTLRHNLQILISVILVLFKGHSFLTGWHFSTLFCFEKLRSYLLTECSFIGGKSLVMRKEEKKRTTCFIFPIPQQSILRCF